MRLIKGNISSFAVRNDIFYSGILVSFSSNNVITRIFSNVGGTMFVCDILSVNFVKSYGYIYIYIYTIHKICLYI
jgi:hypothetical protein